MPKPKEEVENDWNTFSRYDPTDGGGRVAPGAATENYSGRI